MPAHTQQLVEESEIPDEESTHSLRVHARPRNASVSASRLVLHSSDVRRGSNWQKDRRDRDHVVLTVCHPSTQTHRQRRRRPGFEYVGRQANRIGTCFGGRFFVSDLIFQVPTSQWLAFNTSSTGLELLDPKLQQCVSNGCNDLRIQ